MNEHEYKDALASLAAGVSVITYKNESSFGGLTVTSFTSLSLHPPQILFCMKKGIQSDGPLQESGYFAVNMLSSDQENVSNAFAGKEDRTELVKKSGYAEGKSGAPLLNGCIANLECRVGPVHDGTDHWIVTAEVIETKVNPDKKPLLYFRREYCKLS